MTYRAREQRGTPTQILCSSTAAKAFEKLLDEGFAPPDLGRYMRLITTAGCQICGLEVVVVHMESTA
jgi:hypothetical protein